MNKLLLFYIAFLASNCNIKTEKDIYILLNETFNSIKHEKIEFIDESLSLDIEESFNVYENFYKQSNEKKEVRPNPMVKKGTEWIFNENEIKEVYIDIKENNKTINWNYKRINNDRVIKANNNSSDIKVKVSRPFFNKKKDKAIIFVHHYISSLNSYGYLLLFQKENKDWKIKGEIDYMTS